MEHKEPKNNQSDEQEENIIQKNKHSISKPLGQLQEVQHFHHRGPEGEEKEQEIRNLFEKIMKENSPNLVKIIDTQVEEAEGP